MRESPKNRGLGGNIISFQRRIMPVRRADNKHGARRKMKPTYCHALSFLSTTVSFHP